MERYQQSLWKYLEPSNFGLKERLGLAIKLTEELKIAHDGYVVHRDLKPTNVMVDAFRKKFTLVDFGIGNRNFGLRNSMTNFRPFLSNTLLRGSCGTPGFNAPEQFSGEKQDFPGDIFSLGKNLILISFEWKIGWNLLLSSEEWLLSQKLEHKLAPLSNLLKFIRRMIQVTL